MRKNGEFSAEKEGEMTSYIKKVANGTLLRRDSVALYLCTKKKKPSHRERIMRRKHRIYGVQRHHELAEFLL